MKNIYITAAEPHTGKSIVALGMMQALLQRVGKVAFFRPILQNFDNGLIDTDINLILSYFDLNMTYDQAYGVTFSRSRELLNSGQRATLIEEILFKYKQLESSHDFILCEGTDFLNRDAAFEFDLNTELATNLGGAVLTVVSGHNRPINDIIDFTSLTLNSLHEQDLDTYALVVNRCNLPVKEQRQLSQKIKNEVVAHPAFTYEPAIFVLPENDVLAKPHLGDVLQHLNAITLSGHDRIETIVENFSLAAGGTDNFLKNLNIGSLVIASVDRTDIILAALASRISSKCPDIAGLLLCGSKKLSPELQNLIKGWSQMPLPILSTPKDVQEVALKLTSLHSKLSPKDGRKIAAALGSFEQSVKTSRLLKHIVSTKSHRISPKMLELKLIDLARRKKTHIVLPEGAEERTLQAAEILLARNAAQLTLIGDEQEIKSKARQLDLNIDAARIINPGLSPYIDDFAAKYFEMRKHKGMTSDQAKEVMHDPIYFATMMLQERIADGLVSGAIHTTANTIRPAFQIIKTKPNVKIASSVFLMCMHNQVFVFGDCAVNMDPTAEELADIAISSVETAKMFGIDPRVAMLSYSTGTSGHGADVDKVAQATEIVRRKTHKLLLEGPIQYDAAVDMDTARVKLPNSKVAGRATVFIFPDLNTGNNTYKAVQRAAGAVAIGPIMQGLNLPVNDLSRGATVTDIVNTIAITAIQAQNIK